jgi:hypothetical protein
LLIGIYGEVNFMPEEPKKLIITRLECPDDAEPVKQEDPSWSDIEKAIRRLDGDEHTLVVLGFGGAQGPHMAVGGGESDRYIVCTTKDSNVFHIVINPNAPDGRCMLVAGGQYGDYPLKSCVSLSEALRAAKTYAETGENDSSLNWQRRG